MKKFIAALLAGLTLFTLVGCSGGSKANSSTPKDYSQIIHDARSDEDNEYDMIFTKGEDGKFTAIDGYSAEYKADQLNEEIRDILMPLLNLEDGQYTAFAASISSMMVRSYAVAIVKPAEGKTDEVKAALEAYVASEQQSMEHYLEDQYLVAKAATVTVAPPARWFWFAPRITTLFWPTLKRLWPRKKFFETALCTGCGFLFAAGYAIIPLGSIHPQEKNYEQSNHRHPKYQRQGLAEGLHRVHLRPD